VTPTEELRLTGRAAWRGLVELVNSNDLTHAASIAYYALLSLFPFLLLVISLLGSITASEDQRLAVLTFVFRYFPTRLDFVATQLDAFRQTRVQVGVAGSLALIWSSLGVFGAITSAVNEAWGVDVSVSTPHLLTALVEEAVSVGSLVRLLQFQDARLVEVTLAGGSPAAGKSVAELGVPRDATIVAVIRERHVIVPRGETVVEPGDEVLVLVTPESEDEVKTLLVGEPQPA